MQLKHLILYVTIFLAVVHAKKLTHLTETYGRCCPDTYILNTTTMICVCPPERSFLTKEKKCIACEDPYFWDSNSLECTACPKNSWYNHTTNSCIGCPAGFILIA
jgi:hypothetical protein